MFFGGLAVQVGAADGEGEYGGSGGTAAHESRHPGRFMLLGCSRQREDDLLSLCYLIIRLPPPPPTHTHPDSPNLAPPLCPPPDIYMMENADEYWAEGTQSWFDATVRTPSA